MPWRPRVRQPIRPAHLAIALLALLLAAIESTLWLRQAPTPRPVNPIARVSALTGRVLRIADSGSAPAAEPLAADSGINVGDELQSRPGSRLTLRRPGGLTIHLGPDANATWDSADELRLTHGTVYVDTEGVGSQDGFVLVTHAGRIRHIGTRFGVEVDQRHVRVTVRDGAVRIGAANGQHDLAAGAEGRIGADGSFISMPLQAQSGPWNWMLGDSPQFALEGRPLHEVAQELAAAAGLTLTWSGTDLVRDADDLVLHGPALALPPRQALDVVLLTTRFRLRDDGQDADGTARLAVVDR
jgi:ferric-dicitrate binding protein FerR (iron transport regulator)